MNIGYNHAIRLIDLLEERGVKHVVGAAALALNRQLRPSRPCFARRLKRFAAFSRKNGRRMACKAELGDEWHPATGGDRFFRIKVDVAADEAR